MTAAFEKNLRRAEKYLARFEDGVLGHFIGGEHAANSAPGETFEDASPVDNRVIARIAAGGAADIDAAAQAAAAAFPRWRDTPGAERRRILHRVADLIAERADEIALVESVDSGQCIRFMEKAALRGAENFRFFADKADEAAAGRSMPASEHFNYSLRQPIGPVGVITPWNTPFMLATWKIAPALACGCTVVHKPAEWSPLSAMLLAEIMHAAGVPPGVINTVNGGGETVGKALSEHPLVRAIAFVGGTETGSAIMRQGAATLKRVHFELGGKNPVLVFADADIERALDAVLFMIYSLNGERCTSGSRLLVERGIAGDFLARVAERARRITVGHPLDPRSVVGPLIHPRHHAKVMRYLELGRAEGATLAAGGAGEGNYIQPTLFCNADNSMRIAREEIFGPVLVAVEFADEDEAVGIANASRYGLAAYLWSEDAARAQRLARRIDAGMVWVNSENNRHLPSPFGGMKDSGIGRDGGDYSFEFYMETKNICVAHGGHRIPRIGA
ncbi:MAG: 5-carboxymethyl-2-hydroxymuconate semialdehyde dehydrogenase [Gammaproteobacteria bacterium]|nr:5-carboxymethyl-2-hydroxymuconate semialdehyde dehydrogenase [Gammaproteobacteria bacterium]MDA8011712.1 5-carboxymethyl-2-hydroxymuconate semialdehyde dehydrogenase [Gammaproteobacteria bacterium]MDA8022188.1 5-carboxymethyl-2-hydroxymuconate semialdehyde dehydrogenase [Gammaproteobacteria bacterium]